jgi:tetratricopeptide (TPR) repeat protein
MKLRIGLVLAGSLAFVAGGCASGGGSAEPAADRTPTPGAETLAQGERPRENQYTREAAGHIEQADAAATPDEAQTHFQAAVTATETALAEDPRNPLPWYQQGMAYVGLGDYAMADSALSMAEELRPVYLIETEGVRERAWISLYQEAAPLVNSGDLEGAVALFEHANEIYQGRPEVMITLGQIYLQLERPDDAISNLQAAQAIIDSDRVEEMDSATAADWREQGEQIPTLIAQAHMESGDYGAAASAIRGLLAEDPENPTYLRNLASLYVQLEQPDSARAMFERILARPGLSSVDYYQVGVGYYQMEDWGAAAQAFQQAAEASPRDRDAIEMWARSLQLGLPPAGDTETASPADLQALSSAAERWIELDPNNRNAYLMLAQAANRLGEGERAGQLVQQIEDLEVLVANIQFQRYREGGGIVTGSFENVSLDPGTPITMTVTFYDANGAEVGTESVTVNAPAQGATASFQVDFNSEQAAAGYGYELATG